MGFGIFSVVCGFLLIILGLFLLKYGCDEESKSRYSRDINSHFYVLGGMWTFMAGLVMFFSYGYGLILRLL